MLLNTKNLTLQLKIKRLSDVLNVCFEHSFPNTTWVGTLFTIVLVIVRKKISNKFSSLYFN